MGDIWDANKVALFLAFFIPGFISLQIYSLFVGVDSTDLTKRLPSVIGYSAIHYALTGWIPFAAPAGTSRAIAAYVVVLVLPILWPPIILLIRDRKKWQSTFVKGRKMNWEGIFDAMLRPEVTPWDRVLTADPRFVRVRLESGRYVGGYFGPGSTVSTYPCERQIYISQAFTMDEQGIFGSAIDGTGVILQGEDIETLETIAIPEGNLKNE